MTEVTESGRVVNLTRLMLGAIGIALIGYGAFRILSQPTKSRPWELVRYLATAVIVHDGVIAPVTLGVGLVITRFVPARARRYLQGTLVAIAVVIPPVLLEIHRRGSQPTVKALENQNYGAHLVVVAAVIAAVGFTSYLIRCHRDRRAASRAAAVSPETGA